MASLSRLTDRLVKWRWSLIGAAVLVVILLVVRVEQGKPTWAAWTGIGADVEETRTQEVQPNGTVTKTTISKKFQSGKTLWDGLSVLGVPFALAGLGFWFQSLQQKQAVKQAKVERARAKKQAKVEKEIAETARREEAIQTYFDRLSDLLVDKNLIAIASKVQSFEAEAEVKAKEEGSGSAKIKPSASLQVQKERLDAAVDVIRARTLAILRRLENDADRKADRKTDVMQFLVESEVVQRLKLPLSGADLSGVNLNLTNLSGTNLSFANLSGANLSGANLSGANLSFASLSGANLRIASLSSASLSGANLSGANLSGANLSDANLSGANLSGANLSFASLSFAENWTEEQLAQAKLCKTKLPPGTSLNRNRDCKELEIPEN